MRSQRILFIAGLLLMSELCSCVSVQPVTVKGVNNFKTEEVLLSPKISFDVLLHNPNSFGLTLKAFKTSAYFNDKLITDVFIDKKVRIGANSDIAIPLKSQPSVMDIITTYLSGKTAGTIKLDGYVTVSKFLFRKKFPFTINTKL